jgi:hypothetical protein
MVNYLNKYADRAEVMNQYMRQCNFCEEFTQFYSEINPNKIGSSKEWNEAQVCKLHRERASEKERCKQCNDILHEYEQLTCICDNCDYKESLCGAPNTPTKGSESSRND